MFAVLAAAAEYELELRAERQSEGMTAAKRREATGRSCGRLSGRSGRPPPQCLPSGPPEQGEAQSAARMWSILDGVSGRSSIACNRSRALPRFSTDSSGDRARLA